MAETKIERHRRLRKELENYFGDACVICDAKKSGCKMAWHEIHGYKHPKNVEYYLHHKEDFRVVCASCHRRVHYFMRNGITDFDKIKAELQKDVDEVRKDGYEKE